METREQQDDIFNARQINPMIRFLSKIPFKNEAQNNDIFCKMNSEVVTSRLPLKDALETERKWSKMESQRIQDIMRNNKNVKFK